MIRKKVLKNGMTVIFKERNNGVVSVAFAVRNGGRNEIAKEKGISHFIEHMLYKGTEKRTAQDIAMEIERNGGELNGFTAEEITAFWCKIPKKHLKVALEVLSDMVKNPLLDEKEVDKERQVIFEEMKMHSDSPRLYTLDKIKSLLYKGDFAVPLIGTKKSMNSNTREKLKKYFERTYVPENMILAVVGSADFDKICSFAENNFVSKKKEIKFPRIKLHNASRIGKRKDIDQANLVFAFHAPPPKDRKSYASRILITLMAEGMSSRLFQEIREKRNLAYAIKGVYEGEKDYAYAMIYAGTPAKNVNKVRKLILEEFKKVSKELKRKELNQVKEQIIGNYLIALEDSYNVLLDLLIAEIRGDAKEVDEFVHKIRAVKLDDVKKLARIKRYSFFALVPE